MGIRAQRTPSQNSLHQGKHAKLHYFPTLSRQEASDTPPHPDLLPFLFCLSVIWRGAH